MIIPKEVQCRTCSQVFCCSKCRQRHEDGNHQEAAMIRKICYICNDRPFPLRKDTKITPNNLLIVHILNDHLPLRCNRCTKVFYSLEDFQSINNSFQFCPANAPGKDSECHLECSKTVDIDALSTADYDKNKDTFENAQLLAEVLTDDVGREKHANRWGRRKSSLVAGDFQPFDDPYSKIDEVDEALLTPLSKINLRWKRKSRQSFESMLSSSNNTSEVNVSEMLRVDATSGQPINGGNNRRKLVRSTSTPMYQWHTMPSIMALKQPNESYSATMGQMSSIHCSSGSETDSRAEDLVSSPQMAQPAPTPPPQNMPNELDKVRAAIIRTNRSRAAATPLRQVMSKSIQRAIAQHTGAYSKMLQPGTQRKMSFNSTSSGMNSTTASPVHDPLDLRTTPVLKRVGSVSSNSANRSHHMGRTNGAELMSRPAPMDSGREKMFEQESNNSTEQSEYFETHRDLDSLQAADDETADRENRDNLRKLHEHEKVHGGLAQSYLNTPKPTGTVPKKVISFHGLDQSTKHGTIPKTVNEDSMEGDEVWGTPRSLSYSYSAIGLGDTFKAYDASAEGSDENDSVSDDVFYAPQPQRRESESKECERNPKILKEEAGKSDTTAGSRLWSIVSNVIRLASRGDVQETLSDGGRANVEAPAAGAAEIVRKAVSFSDDLKSKYKPVDAALPRTSSSGSEEYRISLESNGNKRRRAATIYSPTFAPATMAVPKNGKVQCKSPVAKRKRIQPRQPIQRFRNISSGSGSGGSSNGRIN